MQVCRNDEIDIAGIERLQPDHLLLSPGPCTPNEAGITLQVIEHFAGLIPILGYVSAIRQSAKPSAARLSVPNG